PASGRDRDGLARPSGRRRRRRPLPRLNAVRARMSPPGVPSPAIALTRRAALTALAIAILVIGGAWFSQLLLGLAPCELCLLQRWPYYIGIPIAAAAALLARSAPRNGAVALLLLLVALIFIVSAGLGVYHAGVEWRFWEGPTACTGQYVSPTSTDD